MIFTILVKEELCRYVDIEAKDSGEALSAVTEMYKTGELILTAEDYNDTSLEIMQVIEK